MNITIGDYDPETRQVSVTFTEGEVTFTRTVNAVHDEQDAYDAAATATRVDEVARGVSYKIAAGILNFTTSEISLNDQEQA